MPDAFLPASVRAWRLGIAIGVVAAAAAAPAGGALLLAMQAAAATPDSTAAGTPTGAGTTPPAGFTRVDRKLTYTKLENRLTLREPFNAAKGKVRVVSFLSPTCPRCQAAATDIQRHFLAKNPSDEFRLFAVWLPATDTDTEESLLTAMHLIPDPRVQHFWDADRVLNAQLLDAVAFEVQMRIFDLHLLYDRETVWEKRLPRPGYFLHEVKGLSGPPWNIQVFVLEVEHALKHEPFSSMSR